MRKVLVKTKYAKDVLTRKGFNILRVDTYYIQDSTFSRYVFNKKTGYVLDNQNGLSARQIKKKYGIVCNII